MYLIDVSAVDGDNGIEEVVSFTWDVNRVSREHEDGHLSSVGFANSLGGALDKALAACYLVWLKVVEVNIQIVSENILDGLPEPMSDQREADFIGASASELKDARSRREEGHEISFLYNRSGTFAMADEEEYDNGVLERVRFAKMLDELKADGMTQGDFASVMGISHACVSRLKTGKTALSVSLAKDIERAFPEYRTAWLLGLDERTVSKVDALKVLDPMVSALSPERMEELLDYVQEFIKFELQKERG